jgi:hypothetical protein
MEISIRGTELSARAAFHKNRVVKLCLAEVQTPENAWARAASILKKPLAFMTKEASKTDVAKIYIETIEQSS